MLLIGESHNHKPSLWSSQSVILGLPSIHVNLMSRWIYTLSTDVAAMYLPWTRVLCWPLAWLFEDKELRTVNYMIQRQTTLYWKRDSTDKWTNNTNDSSYGTDRRELNLDIEQWNPPLVFNFKLGIFEGFLWMLSLSELNKISVAFPCLRSLNGSHRWPSFTFTTSLLLQQHNYMHSYRINIHNKCLYIKLYI